VHNATDVNSPPDRSQVTQHAGQDYQLQQIATTCSSGTCPTIYRSGHGTLVVQGYAVSVAAAGVAVPAGELLVEIPVELLMEAARLHK
jgi:hypothetical protein